MFCKHCGKEIKSDVKFCPKCGKQLLNISKATTEKSESQETSKKVFCKFCGNETKANVKFCPKCGREQIDKNTTKTNLAKEDKKQDPSNVTKKRFCKFCGSAVTVAAKFCPKCGKEISALKDVKTDGALPNSQETILINKDIYESQNKVQHSGIQQNAAIKTDDEKFGVKNIFSQVFKIHTSKERDEIMRAGLYTDENTENIKITPNQFQPWLYSRVLIILLVVFCIFEICLLGFGNSNVMPGVMLIGSLMLPFSILTLYFELNIYRDISFYKTIGIFLLGGALSLLFTLLLYEIIPNSSEFNIIGASLISITEELGKAVIVIMLLRNSKKATILQGLLIGGAIGCGFAVFESAGYAFNAYLETHDLNTRADIVNNYILPWYAQKYGYADDIGSMNFNILLRSILSFGGHTAWAAITGAAYAKTKKIDFDFIKLFSICFVLHAIWDTDTPAVYLKMTCLCLAAWHVIIRQISNFIEENKFKE